MGFDPRNSISVRGTGKVTCPADVARVHIGVERTAPTVGEALATAGEGVRRATDAARGLGLTDRDIASGSLMLRPVFGDQGEQDIRGYAVSQSLIFTVRELATVGRLITRLGEELGAALRIQHMGTEIADTAPLLERARASAMEAARAQAEALAAQAGRQLGAVLVIEAEAESSPESFGGGSMRMLSASFSPEAGEQEVFATVRVVYELD